MNPVVVLLIVVGLFLVMESVADKRVENSVSKVEIERGRQSPAVLDTCLYEQQLSGKGVRDYITEIIEDSGPWMYRDTDLGLAVDDEPKGEGEPAANDSSRTEGFRDWMEARTPSRESRRRLKRSR